MREINVPTKRSTILNGVLFDTKGADTVVKTPHELKNFIATVTLGVW